MKIVVTGGNGMIGKNLQTIADGSTQWLFPSSSEMDLLSLESIDTFFSKHSIDFIVHLAANVGGLYKNLKYKVEMFRENIIMNENILFCAHKHNIQNGLFFCSTCIFPDQPSKYPMTEDMIMEGYPHTSNASYAYAKRFLYFQCQNYNHQYERKYVCITPCNIYGRYDNFHLEDSHVVPALIHKFYLSSLSGDTLTIHTGLNSMRQFIHAKDVAQIIQEMIFNFHRVDYTNIILADEEIRIVDIIQIISEHFPTVHYDIIDTERGQEKKACSNALFRDIFPSYQFLNIRDGLRDTIEWFLNNINDIRK